MLFSMMLLRATASMPAGHHIEATASMPASLHIETGITSQVTYEPTWESLDARPTPAWWTRQKFSLFMHWGLYAVPGFCPVTPSQKTCYAEHFWDTSHRNGSAQNVYMREHYGLEFIYQDFAPLMKCENFDPAGWAKLFKASGAQGLTMTSKHHEGWTLWPNPRHANWNAMDTGPHRDLLQEVGDAVRAEGLRFGFYYSLLEWDRQYTNDTGTAHYRTDFDYVNRTMIPDLRDLVTRYNPDVLYTDGEWDYPSDHWQTKPFLAWLFNESPVKDTIAINDRWGNDCRGKHGGFYVCEYGGEVGGSCITSNPGHPWTSHEGMGKSFGYNKIDEYKSASYFVGLLVQSVAFGGHLQLNVGPTADGRVPQVQQDILLQVGRWLATNGEAIYNTTSPFKDVGVEGCATPPAPPQAQAAAAALNDLYARDFATFTAVPGTKSTAKVVQQMTGATIAQAEAACLKLAWCAGFNYFKCAAPNGCATLKRATTPEAADATNTLYKRTGFVPPPAPPPAPPRQCYTQGGGGGAHKDLYIMTSGWTSELFIATALLPPSFSASMISLVGMLRQPTQPFAVKTQGNMTTIAVPSIALSQLPAADVESHAFVFKISAK